MVGAERGSLLNPKANPSLFTFHTSSSTGNCIDDEDNDDDDDGKGEGFLVVEIAAGLFRFCIEQPLTIVAGGDLICCGGFHPVHSRWCLCCLAQPFLSPGSMDF